MLWVTADTQTSGRGRHGRSWISKAGEGLWVSYAYWGNPDTTSAFSIEIAHRLQQLFAKMGLETTVKPPNDLLVDGKKLCGILCETAWEGDRVAHIVGIGINVRSSPEGLDQLTTSLWDQGIRIEIEELLAALQEAIN